MFLEGFVNGHQRSMNSTGEYLIVRCISRNKLQWNLILPENAFEISTCQENFCLFLHQHVNTLRPKQNGCRFAEDIFNCIFLYDIQCILFWISLKFDPWDTIKNYPALVQIMAWHWTSNKPLYEPMMAWLTDAYICITRSWWLKLNTTTMLAQH